MYHCTLIPKHLGLISYYNGITLNDEINERFTQLGKLIFPNEFSRAGVCKPNSACCLFLCTREPAKHKIFTLWVFIEKVCHPGSGAAVLSVTHPTQRAFCVLLGTSHPIVPYTGFGTSDDAMECGSISATQSIRR